MLSTLLTISLIINEIMASNIEGNVSPATNFDSWIELYNPSDTTVNLAGMYLSNEPDNLTKWRMPAAVGKVPAQGYKVVWLGSNDIKRQQAPFKLDCDGGTIILSSADGTAVAQEHYPEALSRTAWARTTDGGSEWSWTAYPTPGATNATSAFASQRLESPVVDTDSRLFRDSLTIQVEIPEECTLHYTVGGNIPTESSPTSATGRFTLTATTNYRFRLFREGWLPSVPVTRSYIKTTHEYTFPVISIVGNQRYFTDNHMGIAVTGTNGRTGNGSAEKRNWNMDWERPVNFSLIMPDGTMAFNQDVEIAVSGGWTRNDEPKSYKLKAGKEFDGQNDLPYSFFPQKPHIRNKTLLLRNGGNDLAGRFKDPAMQTILQRSGIDLDLQSYVPVIEYINGKSNGVINLREPNNRKFVEANYGYDDDEIDMFEMSADSNVYMMCGSAATLERIYELGQQAGGTTTYEEIKQLLDIDEYINYMAMQLYLCSKDWPHNNTKGYRSQHDGRYRFVTFDLDLIFRVDDPFQFFADHQWHTFNLIYDTQERRHEEIKLVTLFLNLLNNNEFRRKFIDTYCIMAGSVFEYSRAEAIINELTDRVRPMMQLHGMSPNSSAEFLLNGLRGHATPMLDRMQQFAPMNLSATERYHIRLDANHPDARLYINDTWVPYSEFEGELFAPTKLKAETPGGYRFAGWKRTFETGHITLIATDSPWRYYDQGELTGTTWRGRTFYDRSWPEGNAPLGYDMQGVNTTLDYGGNDADKRPTYYLRYTLSLSQAPASTDIFTLNYRLDDAAIVYVNGEEVARINLPEGDITYNTFSNTLVGDNPQSGSISIPNSLLRAGRNAIAVELHNWKATSSDIFWEAELLQTSVGEDDGYYATDPQITLAPLSGQHFTATFVPLTDAERDAQHITPIRINEVSAANDAAVNEYWKRNDWVELYNTTDKPIDIAGMYLTDDPTEPHKYAIASDGSNATTLIPAHGHLTIWCDKLPTMTYLHAPFKLSAEGGQVMLTAADDAWSDTLDYPAHGGDESVGRYPDGNNATYQFAIPTIAKANMRTSYAAFITDDTPGTHLELVTSAATQLTAHYAAGELIVRGTAASEWLYITVATPMGKTVQRLNAPATGSCTIVPLALPQGIYIATVHTSSSASATVKFIIKGKS